MLASWHSVLHWNWEPSSLCDRRTVCETDVCWLQSSGPHSVPVSSPSLTIDDVELRITNPPPDNSTVHTSVTQCYQLLIQTLYVQVDVIEVRDLRVFWCMALMSLTYLRVVCERCAGLTSTSIFWSVIIFLNLLHPNVFTPPSLLTVYSLLTDSMFGVLQNDH